MIISPFLLFLFLSNFKVNPRQFILLLISFFSVVIFFNMPGNKKWLNERVLNFTDKIHDEIDMMSLEERRVYRFGGAYNASMAVQTMIKSWNMKEEPLILLPPREYVKRFGIDVNFPEPLVFYYYTGLKSVQYISKDVYKANLALVFDGSGQLNIAKIKNKDGIKEILQLYKTNQPR